LFLTSFFFVVVEKSEIELHKSIDDTLMAISYLKT